MGKNILLAAIVGAACLSANAAVEVNLDGHVVSDVRAIQYNVGSGLFEVVLGDNLVCQGAMSSGAPIDLEVGVGGQVFALNGPITMNFSSEPVTLTINSALGNVNCSDRIFSDRLTAEAG